MDKAGLDYWGGVWSHTAQRRPVDPDDKAISNTVELEYHRVFERLLTRQQAVVGGQRPLRLLEIGAANSAWLPYFAKRFGCEIWGLDYSDRGCRAARTILANQGLAGQVVCADLFDPPDELAGYFDVVVSFGLVEHFEPAHECLSAIRRYLGPDGVVFTCVPNMAGLIGWVQEFLNRRVYDIHQILDREDLHEAHERAGLRVRECDYFLATHFGVCNLNGIPATGPGFWSRKAVLAGLTRLSMLVWQVERWLGKLPRTRLGSPYVNCVAERD